MRSLRFSGDTISRIYGNILFSHNGTCSSSCAYELNDVASIRIMLPRFLGVISVSLHIFSEDLAKCVASVGGEWEDLDSDNDIYEFSVDLRKIGVGLYFFKLSIDTQYGQVFGAKCTDGVSFSYDFNRNDYFQLSVSDFKYEENKNKYGGIIYHIFVDRFNKGGESILKDGVIVDDDWKYMPEYPAYPGAPLKNNHFYGGTLYGVADKLDYIKSLGVNTIYLSPVFDAASNHKYDTADYMNVDSMFGGNDALKHLISEAKKRGIGIILDGVFNHTGADSIYFNKYGTYRSVGAYQSKKSKFYSWFDFQSYPDKYTSWWGIDILPRINPANPECEQYFVGKGGVIEKYAKMGIDGFRLDVVDELPDEFVAKIKKKLDSYNKRSVLYGEVWEDASNKIAYDKRKRYYLGTELDGVMNYPIRKGIISFLTKSDISDLRYALTDVINNAPKRIRDMQMNLLGTHDTERILTVLGGSDSGGRSNDYLSRRRMDDLERGTAKRRLRMAYAILATLPGIPAIFYADEAGMEGYQDPFNRMPYPWGKEDKRLIDYYRKIGKIRSDKSVYKTGEFHLLHLTKDCLIFARTNDDKALFTVVNNTNLPLNIEFSSDAIALINNLKFERTFKLSEYTTEIFEADRNVEISF